MAAIEEPGDQIEGEGVSEAEAEGGEFGGTEGYEQRIVHGLAPPGEAPETGDQAAEDIDGDGVGAVVDQRRGPAFPTLAVDEPVERTQCELGEASGEDGEGHRPDLLVDGHDKPQQIAGDGEGYASSQKPSGLFGEFAAAAEEMAGEGSEEQGGNCGKGADDALGVPDLGGSIEVAGQEHPIDVLGEVADRFEDAGAVTGDGVEGHQHPVRSADTNDDGSLAAPGGVEKDERPDEIADSDALEDTGDPDSGEVVGREAGEEQPEAENQRAAAEGVADEDGLVSAFFDPSREGECHGDADDPQKEGENEVGGRPAVPVGVKKRGICLGVRAEVIDKHHGCDGGAAKGIERDEPLLCR